MNEPGWEQQEDNERRRFEEELTERGLDWLDYWDKREQDMRDQRDFWKKWEVMWQLK